MKSSSIGTISMTRWPNLVINDHAHKNSLNTLNSSVKEGEKVYKTGFCETKGKQKVFQYAKGNFEHIKKSGGTKKTQRTLKL
jgi:hypothetical protein